MSEVVPLLPDREIGCIELDRAEPGFGAIETAAGRLPLREMDVSARITGLECQILLRQSFVNSYGQLLEATYVFPLPDRAAVSRFKLEVAGRTVEGVLKERGAARQEYDRAIEAGHRAAIAEEERPGVFTIRAGNIPPGEEATVELELSGPLPCVDGEATFRFPLVVAPRYIPGTPLPGVPVGDGVALDTDAVPDASRISPPTLLPGFPSGVRLRLGVTIDPAGLPITRVRSSLHAVSETVSDEGGQSLRRIEVRPGERLDRDFILRLELAATEPLAGLTMVPDADDPGSGTFALFLVPPRHEGTRLARDVVFVLDRSGSMSGWKLVAARRAVGRMIDSLTPEDRFALITFDDRAEVFGARHSDPVVLQPASDRNRFRAVEHLGRVESRGGTEMARPLVLAASLLSRAAPGRERSIVLVTDGQVGNEDQLVRQVHADCAGMRIFTVGIDQAVNTSLLRRLSEPTGGVCELVEGEDRLDEVLRSIHRRIGRPVLTGLTLGFEGVTMKDGTRTPNPLPDVFEGVPATVMGRYSGPSGGAIAVRGRLAGGAEYEWRITGSRGSSAAIRKAWARARVRDLEDRYAAEGRQASGLAEEIVRLSLAEGVLSRFTAFVAVDETERLDTTRGSHRVIQPVELPAGWGPPAVARMTGVAISASAPIMRSARIADDVCELADFGKPTEEIDAMPGDLGGLDRLSGDFLADEPSASPRTSKRRETRGPGRQDSAGGMGLLGNLLDMMKDLTGKPASKGKQRPPLDLDAWRELLRSLGRGLERIEKALDDEELHRELADLLADLKKLLERLKRESGPGFLAHLLEKIRDTLERREMSAASRLRDLARAARTELDELLGDVAEDRGSASRSRRDEFWK